LNKIYASYLMLNLLWTSTPFSELLIARLPVMSTRTSDVTTVKWHSGSHIEMFRQQPRKVNLMYAVNNQPTNNLFTLYTVLLKRL